MQAEAEARARQMQAEAQARDLEDSREQLELIDLQRHKSMRRWDIAKYRKDVLAEIRAQRTSVEDFPVSMTLPVVRFTNLDRIRVFSSESTPLSSSLAACPAPIDLPSTERLPSPPKSCLKRKNEEVTTEARDSSEPSEKRSAP
jgi:hypothetical protein